MPFAARWELPFPVASLAAATAAVVSAAAIVVAAAAAAERVAAATAAQENQNDDDDPRASAVTTHKRTPPENLRRKRAASVLRRGVPHVFLYHLTQGSKLCDRKGREDVFGNLSGAYLPSGCLWGKKYTTGFRKISRSSMIDHGDLNFETERFLWAHDESKKEAPP